VTDLHPDGELLMGLALDDIDESDRESVLHHLETCRQCRQEYDSLSSTIDHTLAAAPRAEPSPGFDRRVLNAMGFSEPVGTWRRRPRWQVLAGGIAAGLVVGIGGGYVLAESTGDRDEPLLADSSYLTTSDGERVGTVTTSWMGDQRVIIVSVTDGPVGKHYACRLRLGSGRQIHGGDWTLKGSGGGTWVVEAPVQEVVAVDLVTDSGRLWSSADL
jgi:hypothetical protein